MSLEPGTTLGAFDGTGRLVAGGLSEVYRARDTKLGREIAIKALPEDFADDLDRLARFERETNALAAANHPHIALIYGFEQSHGVHFVARLKQNKTNSFDDAYETVLGETRVFG